MNTFKSCVNFGEWQDWFTFSCEFDSPEDWTSVGLGA